MNNKLNEVVIVAAARTPIGSYKGSLKDIKADKLGSLVIEEAINRSGIDKKEVSEVIMGQVLTAGAGQNPARQAAINAGLSKSNTCSFSQSSLWFWFKICNIRLSIFKVKRSKICNLWRSREYVISTSLIILQK
jgi:hypothetical protein